MADGPSDTSAPAAAAPAIPATQPAQGKAPAPTNGAGRAAAPSSAEATANAGATAAAVAEATGGDARRYDPDQHGDVLVELVVAGERQAVPLRELIEAGGVRNASLVRGAHKKMEEAAAERKRAESVLSALKENLGAVLHKLGPQAVKAALKSLVAIDDPVGQRAVEEAFAEIMAEAQKPPEQRRTETLEERERRIAEREAAFAAQVEEQRLAAQTTVTQRKLTKAFGAALESAGLPKTPDTMQEMVVRARELAAVGLDVSDPDVLASCVDLVAEAVESRRVEAAKRFAGLPPEKLAEMLGPETLRALREYEIAKVSAANAAKMATPVAPPAPKLSAQAERSFRSMDDVLADITKKRGAAT